MEQKPTRFYSEAHLSSIFKEDSELLESLRASPVKIAIDSGITAGDKFYCELSNKGFKYTFEVSRISFSSEDFRQTMVDLLTDLGVPVI